MDGNAIGPYRTLEALGHGGMGVVYRARHIVSDERVALKTVKVPTPRWLASIRREIQALTRIRHPGVVRIVDHGVSDGRPWYAMDLLVGESLRQFGEQIWRPYQPTAPTPPTEAAVSATLQNSEEIEADPVSTSLSIDGPASRRSNSPPAAGGRLVETARIMQQVCATLAFLHGEGFINCDLKPDNIVIVRGVPIIIDFGLIAHHPGGSGREELEAQRVMAGTLPYMSPEQIRGEFVDARADLYAVGCMLYELVVGRVPFTGVPGAIVAKHLSVAPVPPAELVTSLPDGMNGLILKLLEKDLVDRFGYADEVASELSGYSQEPQRPHDWPPPREYLYRPRFVGRSALIRELCAMREAAIDGSGSLVVLGGESGVGKTRVAMEVTRVAPGSMRVITSEASPFSADGVPIGSAPLQALRPLLQAVADRCQEGGPDVTERLLGHRHSVLGLYEPLLRHVPTTQSLPPALPLDVNASRERLFRYLGETLASFAEEQPILLVLDDLSWADELSIAFLLWLTPDFIRTLPAFMLCTCRTEEASNAAASLLTAPQVKYLALARLDPGAVQSMVVDMLATRDRVDSLVDFVVQQSEGNPFFVAEYLRAAMTERVLYRNRRHSWGVLADGKTLAHEYASLALPRSLRELIEHRLRNLEQTAGRVVVAAAVLGRETEFDVLHEIAGIPFDLLSSAVDELVHRQVLEHVGTDSIRFVHDKLREVAYDRASPSELVRLHERAATALEARLPAQVDPSRQWTTLGHHFAEARKPAQAAHYLHLAAEHARSTFANRDAISLYRQALNLAERAIAEGNSEPIPPSPRELHEAIGDILALTNKRDEARTAYGEALLGTPEQQSSVRARLYRKLGKTWESQHEHATALEYYELAKKTLSARSDAGSEGRGEWIQVHIEQLWVHYWLNDVTAMEAILETLRPLIESDATPLQQARFFEGRMLFNFRRDRYLITEETLGFARAAVEACRQGGEAQELPGAQLMHGMALLFQRSLDSANAELAPLLVVARRAGDKTLEARCLTYLALAARMSGQTGPTREYNDSLARVAAESNMLEYIAAARANEAWLHLRAGDLEQAVVHARRALELWKERVFPFQWTALLPLMEAELGRTHRDEAIRCAEALLAPSQQYLPGAAADALARAIRLAKDGRGDDAETALRLALRDLARTGHR